MVSKIVPVHAGRLSLLGLSTERNLISLQIYFDYGQVHWCPIKALRVFPDCAVINIYKFLGPGLRPMVGCQVLGRTAICAKNIDLTTSTDCEVGQAERTVGPVGYKQRQDDKFYRKARKVGQVSRLDTKAWTTFSSILCLVDLNWHKSQRDDAVSNNLPGER